MPKTREDKFGKKGFLLYAYTRLRAACKRSMGKNSTADLYLAAAGHFYRFAGNRDMPVRDLTATQINDFQSYLQAKGLKVNTINSYLSSLRAVYNAAFNEHPFKIRVHPFGNLRLKRDMTVKDPLTEKKIRRLATADFPDKPELSLAVGLSLFSFMAYGMPFADMVRLTKKNILRNTLVYNRHKTGIQIRIEITIGMRRILDKYRREDSEYLFPVMFPNASHGQYKTMLTRHNKALVRIGKITGIHDHLTSYVFRYTWAAEAQRLHVDISVISQGMGHTSEKTTRGYLNRLDQNELDKANRVITQSINNILINKQKGGGGCLNRPYL